MTEHTDDMTTPADVVTTTNITTTEGVSSTVHVPESSHRGPPPVHVPESSHRGPPPVHVPESSHRGPPPVPHVNEAPVPNPRLIVTQPSTDSLYNVVRYNPSDSYEGILEESPYDSDQSSLEQEEELEESGLEGGNLKRYGSVSEGLDELINSLNDMVGQQSSETEDDYVNQEAVDSFVGRSAGEVSEEAVDSFVGRSAGEVSEEADPVEERPVSAIQDNVQFFESFARREGDLSDLEVNDEDDDLSEGEVKDFISCSIRFSQQEQDKDLKLFVETEDDIFTRSINENIEFFEGLNKIDSDLELQHVQKPEFLRRAHSRGLSNTTDKQSLTSLDREAMDAGLADLDAEIETLKNMTTLDNLIGDFVADLEGSFSNDPVDSDEVLAIEQLIEMRERALNEATEMELKSKKRTSKRRSRSKPERVRERASSGSLTEEERDAALLALYAARIHQRRSFNKNFIKILYQSSPDLAFRENIVAEAKNLNNSLDRFQLKSYQSAAALEYGKLKSDLMTQKRQGRSKKPVKIGIRPKSLSQKNAQHSEKNDLALLVDEIANAFPVSKVDTDSARTREKDQTQKYSKPEIDIHGQSVDFKLVKNDYRAVDSEGGGYDSLKSGDSTDNKTQNRKTSLDDHGGGYDSLTTGDERILKASVERKNSLDADGGGYDSMPSCDEKILPRKNSLEAEGGGYDSLGSDNEKIPIKRKASLDADGGGYDSMPDSAEKGAKTAEDGGGYDSMSSDLMSPRKGADTDGGGYDSMSDEPLKVKERATRETPEMSAPTHPPSRPPTTPLITQKKTSPPYSRPKLPFSSAPSHPKLPSEPPPTVPDHVSSSVATSTDRINKSLDTSLDKIKEPDGNTVDDDDGYDGDSTYDSSFVLSSLSGICDSVFSSAPPLSRTESDSLHHYDSDPDDVSFSDTHQRPYDVVFNDYIIGPTDAHLHRRTQSIAVMEHQMKKCDSLLEDFDYIQLQQYRKHEVINTNFVLTFHRFTDNERPCKNF